MIELRIERVATPIGDVLLATGGGRLWALEFDDGGVDLAGLLGRRYGAVLLLPAQGASEIAGWLRAYFDGDLRALDAIPVETGGTLFQREVWAALRDIPPGSTLSYSALAARLGRPAATRAVGAANGHNPVSVVVPCHRLVGAGGSLVKYGGGLARKQWLLRHEGFEGRKAGDERRALRRRQRLQ